MLLTICYEVSQWLPAMKMQPAQAPDWHILSSPAKVSAAEAARLKLADEALGDDIMYQNRRNRKTNAYMKCEKALGGRMK